MNNRKKSPSKHFPAVLNYQKLPKTLFSAFQAYRPVPSIKNNDCQRTAVFEWFCGFEMKSKSLTSLSHVQKPVFHNFTWNCQPRSIKKLSDNRKCKYLFVHTWQGEINTARWEIVLMTGFGLQSGKHADLAFGWLLTLMKINTFSREAFGLEKWAAKTSDLLKRCIICMKHNPHERLSVQTEKKAAKLTQTGEKLSLSERKIINF